MGWVLTRVELTTDAHGHSVLRVGRAEIVLREKVRRSQGSAFTAEEVIEFEEAFALVEQ